MDQTKSDFDACLDVIDLEKSYRDTPVVSRVSLEVKRGEIVAILGPNGAGKTTVMSMISGILKPDSGNIKIDGTVVTELPMYARAQLGLSYLPQEPSVFRGMSVEDNLIIAMETSLAERAQRAKALEIMLDVFGLTELRKHKAGKLSGGQRRRCEVARALATRPNYLILDEPFAGVDPLAISELQHTIRKISKSGIGVLISDHNVRETLRIVDRAYVMVDGRILAQGNSQDVASNDLVRRHYLGDSLD